jgi:hypothetical protein
MRTGARFAMAVSVASGRVEGSGASVGGTKWSRQDPSAVY